LIYFHGGEWRGGSRKGVADHLSPYLAQGFVVVAVGYRGAKVALAPAAVTDARCAYHWVVNNSPRYGIDRKRIVLSGHSAGGHLALITGYLTPAAKLDGECRSLARVKPTAVVAWNAPSDLKQYMFQRLADGAPIDWLQTAAKAPSLADVISPIVHARKGVPPTISLHAAGDPEVPHSQAANLHQKLSSANVLNELVTLQRQGHLTPEHPPSEVARAYDRVFRFLGQSGVMSDKARRK
jgi:acetyl esterase/lipase